MTGLSSNNYWSSSEKSANNAWNVNFNNDNVNNNNKNNNNYVRFVRDIMIISLFHENRISKVGPSNGRFVQWLPFLSPTEAAHTARTAVFLSYHY